MFILSFDIGIKNLAFCKLKILSNQYKICQWDIINLSYESSDNIDIDNLIKNYKSMRIKDLKLEIEKLNLKIDINDKKKKQLIKILEDYFIKNGLIKKKLSILDIGKIMIKKLDQLNLLSECDIILIENQPSLKNPIMKSVQMLLFSYCIIRGFIDNLILTDLRLISAQNKLKKCQQIDIFKDRSKNYKDRKKLAIDYCKYIIDNDINNLDFFNQNSKKDDLADCFLQAIYYIDSQKLNCTIIPNNEKKK